MKKSLLAEQTLSAGKAVTRFFLNLLPLAVSYFLVELFVFALMRPAEYSALAFGALWAVLLSAVTLLLPRSWGRVAYGVTYYIFALWAIAQAGYYSVFDKMMWFSTIFFADEGAGFLGDVIGMFPPSGGLVQLC